MNRLPAAVLLVCSLSAALTRAEVPFSFTLPQAGPTSAGVYDADGRLVRVLWSMQDRPAGVQSATWDERDAFGAPAPAGTYHWRVVGNGSTYRNVGVIGNNGQPPDAAGHTPNRMQSLAVDAAGAVYTANGWDEAGADFKKWDPAGTSLYDARYQIRNGKPNGAPYSIAVDDAYLYCGMGGWNREPFNSMQQIQRFRLSDGQHVKFTEVGRDDGHILVYEWPEKQVPAHVSPDDAKLMASPLRSLAVVGETIYAADALGGRVLRYHKVTGKPLGAFRVPLPLALAADRQGRIWVAHEHHTLSICTPEGQLRPVLTGLGDVTALAFTPEGALCVADADAGQVQTYDVSAATPRLLRTFGQKAGPGDAAPDHFFRLAGVAVDKDHNRLTINLLPHDGSRLAKWSPAGKLLWERLGLEFVSLGNYGQDDPDRFYSMTLHGYRLLDRAAGTWEFTGCMAPQGVSYRSDPHGTPRVLRIDGRPFLYLPMGDGMQVYRIAGRVLKLAALVGGKEPTHDARTHRHPHAVKGEAGMWTWSDRNGNGAVDADEIRWFKHHEEQGPARYAAFGMDVDAEGNIWFVNLHGHAIWELPRGQSDAEGNPTYDWSQFREITTRDTSPVRFEPSMAQHADDGQTYAFGWSALAPSPRNNPFWMGGSTLACFDRRGQRRWAVVLPETCVGLDVIPGGGCMLGGAKSARIYHYTADGLLIGQMQPGAAMGKQSGWLDNQASLAVNRDPRDRVLDVFVEEDYALRIAWYRVDDRQQTTLTGALEVAAPPAGKEPSAGVPRYYYPLPPADPQRAIGADVCVYGATPGGVTAAVQAARMGKQVVLVEFGRHLGGMTASGLSDTDGGEPAITGGLADEFYARLGKRAKFRPSEAERTFRTMLFQAGVPVFFEHRLRSVVKDGRRIAELAMENGNRFRAAMFIDATYEGDLLARAGVSYTVGREANATYGERINGVVYGPKDNFDRPLDPFVVPGQPDSGLLPGISPAVPGPVGSGDRTVQAYNFRMWLVPADQGRPFPKPEHYDANRYALLLRYIAAGNQHLDLRAGDNNNHHAFHGACFTDDIGMNYAWPEADYPAREQIYQEHVTYQQGLMYFLANDPRVPEKIRKQVCRFGLPRDEFAASGGWPHQLYVREARRMLGAYVMTEHNGTGQVVANDGIALASYPMDSHNTQRVVLEGKVSNEGQTYEKVAHPLPLSYRAICPRQAECENLLVVFAVSASHIGLSTLRMEPVLMITGQSAATAACLSIDEHTSVQKLPYGKLRARLLRDGQILQVPQPK